MVENNYYNGNQFESVFKSLHSRYRILILFHQKPGDRNKGTLLLAENPQGVKSQLRKYHIDRKFISYVGSYRKLTNLDN